LSVAEFIGDAAQHALRWVLGVCRLGAAAQHGDQILNLAVGWEASGLVP